MISSIFFIIWRLAELLFLIPMVGMLSYLIHGYVTANVITPDFVLVIFIVTVVAAVWALGTLLFFGSTKHSGRFVALVDLGLFGALIASVAVLRGITGQSCSAFAANPNGSMELQLSPFAYELEKACALLKASFAFAIIEILLFFGSFIWALFVHHHHRNDKDDNYSRREKHSSRHHHRRSSSRGGSRAGSRAPSSRYESRSRRSGSHSRRHSSRHSYV